MNGADERCNAPYPPRRDLPAADSTRRMRAMRRIYLLPLLLTLGLTLACEGDEEYTTVVVGGFDCGLIRNDLLGTWTVTFAPGSTELVFCDDPAFDNVVVDVLGGDVTFTNVNAIASPSSTTFIALGVGPNLTGPTSYELLATVEADSCLALVQVWEEDDQAWMQCIGTLDLTSARIDTICDSADLDTDGDEEADVACDLNTSFAATVLTP